MGNTAAVRSLSDIPPMMGHLPLVGNVVQFYRDLPALMRSLNDGASRLQRLRVPGGVDMVVWGDLESFDLFKHKSVSSAHQVDAGEVVFGMTSMISSDGAEHKRRRKASGHSFTPRGLTMSGVSAVISEVVTERVASMLNQSEVLLLEESQVLAIDIIFRVMGVPREELREWTRKYTEMQSAVGFPQWNIPGSPYYRARRARDWVDERLRGYIEQARRDPEMTGLVAEFVRGRDDEGQAMDDQEVLDNLRLMAFAGHETTASTIAWMASYAATNPDIHDRLMAEALAGDGLPETPKDMGAFPYAEGMFREALRLHPPVTLSSRRMTEDVVIDGYALPAGTIVGIPIWLFGRDPARYPEPDRFRPERWLGDEHARTPIETSAFGGGAHFCLGYHMAWVEAVQTIVGLMRGLDEAGLRLSMPRLPAESYIPLLRPRMKDTRCRFVKA
jgi:cytochrome P450